MINVEIVRNYAKWREHKQINKSLIKKITRNVLLRFDNFLVKSVEFDYKAQGAKPITNRRATSNDVSEFKSFYYSKIKQFELSILLTNSEEILTLNKQFRNIEKATNVLSFPTIEFNWQDLRFSNVSPKLELLNDYDYMHLGAYMHLGDIAFCYEVIYNESCEQQKTFENHFIHLLIHSILHLIGFDHQNDTEANIMENLEIEILAHFGISSPY